MLLLSHSCHIYSWASFPAHGVFVRSPKFAPLETDPLFVKRFQIRGIAVRLLWRAEVLRGWRPSACRAPNLWRAHTGVLGTHTAGSTTVSNRVRDFWNQNSHNT